MLVGLLNSGFRYCTLTFKSSFHIACLAPVCLFRSPEVLAYTLEDQKWLQFRSANFHLYSQIGVYESRDILAYLELLRAAVPAVTKIRSTPPSVPTILFIVDRRAEFTQLDGRDHITSSLS